MKHDAANRQNTRDVIDFSSTPSFLDAPPLQTALFQWLAVARRFAPPPNEFIFLLAIFFQ
jgi:hypothetical protein